MIVLNSETRTDRLAGTLLGTALGISPSGVVSAGNGSAMRAAIIGTFFADRSIERQAFGRVLAEVTHRDPRAIEGTLYVAELAASCSLVSRVADLPRCQEQARRVVTHDQLGSAIDQGRNLALFRVETMEAALVCGTSGFVVHTLGFATFCFLRFGHDPMQTLTESIAAGGDTDSIAAILGGWLGALHGESGLPWT